MDISLDSAKSEKNLLARSISFELAAEFEWDGALIAEDLRKDNGERARPINARSNDMKRKPNPKKVDRENPAWTKETFARARKARDVLPEIFGAGTAAKMLKPRGRPKSGKARTSISLRLPPETLARWKATGPGWQTRMAEALSKAV